MSAPDKAKDSALDDAKEFLNEMLSEGEMPWADIDAQRKIRGIANKTLQRAKQSIGATSQQYKDKNGVRQWLWKASE